MKLVWAAWAHTIDCVGYCELMDVNLVPCLLPTHTHRPIQRDLHKLGAPGVNPHQFHLTILNMFLRLLLAFALFSSAASVTLVICQQYCASVQGTTAYNNCSPWNSYATHPNQTCYNLCVHNCLNVYDGSCMSNLSGFRCCFPLTPQKTQQFKTSGCNKIYNNLPGWYP